MLLTAVVGLTAAAAAAATAAAAAAAAAALVIVLPQLFGEPYDETQLPSTLRRITASPCVKLRTQVCPDGHADGLGKWSQAS